MAFTRLHPRLQRWVYDRGWTSLHDAQERAIGPILDGDRDVLISAATAAGKTEAAFLPICSAITPPEGVAADRPDPDPWTAHDPWAEPAGPAPTGVEVLYISPLKALVNDQYDRLELLCERAGVAVHRWHGDVAGSSKQKLLRSPSGVLLITPESLEAIFVNRGAHVPALFARIRYVVVDELHAFLATPRGAQLQTLLHRVDLAVRRQPPRIGLSATLSNLGAAAEFLRPGRAAQVLAIESVADGQELRLQVRGYRAEPPRLSAGQAMADEAAGRLVTIEDTVDGGRLAVSDHIFGTLRGRDNLVFANSRRAVEVHADLLRRRCEAERVPNEFWPHHGSLSKDLREQVEAELKGRTRPVTAVCTSTLEMGVDIGSVASVAQIGPPPSVAALRQRLGRSGRRDQPAVIRIYVSEPDLDVRSTPVQQLRTDLVQTVAMVRLLLRSWLEPPLDPGLNLSTLVQQVLSLVAQHGGVTPLDAHRVLCGSGPFEQVDQSRFARLLRSMAGADLLVQAQDGALLHGPTGEKLVNHYSFYAAFQTSEEWRLVAGGRSLGSLPISHPFSVGELLIFGGRRWRIIAIDPRSRLIELVQTSGGVPPDFGGSGAVVADEVRREMADVYASTDVPAWLDESAGRLLGEGRDAWRRLGLESACLVGWGTDTLILPWVGDAALVTISMALRTLGLGCNVEGPSLHVPKHSPGEVAAAARQLVAEPRPSGTDLARGLENLEIDKWDWVLDQDLAAETAGARQLDVPTAWALLERLAADTGIPPTVVLATSPAVESPAPMNPPSSATRPRRPGDEFCIVDVETTGFSPRLGDRVVEVASVRMRADGTITDEWSTLVNPRRDVGATHVHGITATDLVDAPAFAEIAGDLLERLDGAVLTAHNLRFDWQFLAAEYARTGHALPPFPSLCTLGLGARLQPRASSRKLSACCQAFGIPLPRAHEALDDANAAARLLAVYIALAHDQGLDSLDALGCEPLVWPLSLPELAPSGRCHRRGSQRHVAEQAHYLSRLVAQLDGCDIGDPQIAAYADLLDRALEDRRLTERESDALLATAADWQMDAATVQQTHRDYLASLVAVAQADDLVTERERGDLDLVATLLALPAGTVDAALAHSESLPATPTERTSDPGRFLPGTTVCFTGTLNAAIDGQPITRALAEELATKAGLAVAKGVSKKLDLLVVADPDTLSGKAQRARDLGTRIMAETVFWQAVGAPVD